MNLADKHFNFRIAWSWRACSTSTTIPSTGQTRKSSTRTGSTMPRPTLTSPTNDSSRFWSENDFVSDKLWRKRNTFSSSWVWCKSLTFFRRPETSPTCPRSVGWTESRSERFEDVRSMTLSLKPETLNCSNTSNSSWKCQNKVFLRVWVNTYQFFF